MATNLNLDDKLLNQVTKLGKHRSKKEAVERALMYYRARLAAPSVIELFGTIDMISKDEFRVMRGKPPLKKPFVLPAHLRKPTPAKRRRAS